MFGAALGSPNSMPATIAASDIVGGNLAGDPPSGLDILRSSRPRSDDLPALTARSVTVKSGPAMPTIAFTETGSADALPARSLPAAADEDRRRTP